MTDGTLPNRIDIEALLADVDAIIGLSASFPASRFNLAPDDRQEYQYAEVWRRIEASLAEVRNKGFPFFHRNQHQTLRGMWAWCISFGTSISGALARRLKTG